MMLLLLLLLFLDKTKQDEQSPQSDWGGDKSQAKGKASGDF
jgi:hypothetical protein